MKTCVIPRIAKEQYLVITEALARRMDELRPGYYDTMVASFGARKLEDLSGCELNQLRSIIQEDIRNAIE